MHFAMPEPELALLLGWRWMTSRRAPGGRCCRTAAGASKLLGQVAGDDAVRSQTRRYVIGSRIGTAYQNKLDHQEKRNERNRNLNKLTRLSDGGVPL